MLRFVEQSKPLSGFALLGLMFLAATGAGAQQRGPQRLVLQALDTDHDGTLSAAEIQAAPKSLLTLDRNGDGQITGDELRPPPENAGANANQLVQQLMQFDKNGDGVLTADELPQRLQNLMERADTDHDGRLTPNEIRALASRQSMPAGASSEHNTGFMRNDPLVNALDSDHDGTISAAEIAAAPQSLLTLDKNGNGIIEPDEMRMRQASPEERVNHMLEEFDTNKDGKISKAEAPDHIQKEFESIDKNGDGLLDRQELLKYFSSPAGQSDGPRRGGQGENSNQHQEHN